MLKIYYNWILMSIVIIAGIICNTINKLGHVKLLTNAYLKFIEKPTRIRIII